MAMRKRFCRASRDLDSNIRFAIAHYFRSTETDELSLRMVEHFATLGHNACATQRSNASGTTELRDLTRALCGDIRHDANRRRRFRAIAAYRDRARCCWCYPCELWSAPFLSTVLRAEPK